MIRRILNLGQPVAKVASDFGLSERCACKWLARFRAEGPAGLCERSSRPKCSPRTTHPLRVARVLALRRRKLPGFQIARATKLSKACVSHLLHLLHLLRLLRLLRRHAHRLAALDPPSIRRGRSAATSAPLPANSSTLIASNSRGSCARDIASPALASNDHSPGAGYEFLHLASDDHCCSGSLRSALRAKRIRFRVTQSRRAFAQLFPDQTAPSAIAFLHAARAFFARHGVKAQRLYSANGSCDRARAMPQAAAALGRKHRFTRP